MRDSISGGLSFKQFHDFWIARLLGKLREGSSLGVACSTKNREALEESGNPFDVTSPYCISKVVQLNP
jgi:hypothetical protein